PTTPAAPEPSDSHSSSSAAPDSSNSSGGTGLWTKVCQLSLHQHAWVRTVSSRIMGAYFALIPLEGWPTQCSPEEYLSRSTLIGLQGQLISPKQPAVGSSAGGADGTADNTAGDADLPRQHPFFQLAAVCAQQLGSPFLDARLGEQVVKNMV